ncbi:signal peptidase II [Fusobacterium sp. PH5-44]|uniref:signal peptidase II n=1 Tax=unclassified Fusobacterium TaxID=2648384 RepID=UPI003D1B2362
MLYIAIFIMLVLVDQITKFLVITRFDEFETIPVIKDFFHITYINNYGIAFGLFQGKLSIVNIITIFVVIYLIYHVYKHKDTITNLEKYGFLLIGSGAVGNIIDRFYRGFVIDMIDFRGIWQYIFNFADAWINIGVFLIIIDQIFLSKKRKDKDKTE